MMWQYGHGMGGWGFGLMSVGGLLVWVLIVAGVVAILRHVIRESAAPRRLPAGSTAEDLLAVRFARGDIAEQEYCDRLDVLRRSGPTRTPDPHGA
jgi:putative membrane protein